MTTLPIEYSDLLILILAIFAFVGIMRGWYKEGITSLFTSALAILVWKPEWANEIIEKVNDLIKLILIFVGARGSLDPSTLAAQTVDSDLLIDPNSYRLYMVITVALLIISYFVGEATFKGRVTPLSRLLGGLFGTFNGFVILSLVRQYFLNYLRSKNEFYVVSDELSIRMTEVPTSSIFAGYGIIFVFIVLIDVVALLVAGDRLRLPLK
jgi:hypothetical protein